MAYVPDAKLRTEEGAQKYGYRLEDLERAEENARHIRAVGGRSRRWLWVILAFVMVVAAVAIIYLFAAPSDLALPTR